MEIKKDLENVLLRVLTAPVLLPFKIFVFIGFAYWTLWVSVLSLIIRLFSVKESNKGFKSIDRTYRGLKQIFI
jgi:hypothetical protein